MGKVKSQLKIEYLFVFSTSFFVVDDLMQIKLNLSYQVVLWEDKEVGSREEAVTWTK